MVAGPAQVVGAGSLNLQLCLQEFHTSDHQNKNTRTPTHTTRLNKLIRHSQRKQR
jgi:hypothetical protein